MAAGQKERTAKLVEKRLDLGEQELRHTVPYSTREMLEELMFWHQIEEVSEAVQLLALNGRAEDLPPAPPKAKDRPRSFATTSARECVTGWKR